MYDAIETHDLTVRFGDTTALDDVDLRLPFGRIHGLLGRNGSGKTTLLSTLAAFRKPTAGRVTIDGRPVFEDAGLVADICCIRGAGDTVTNDWPDDKVEDALAFAAVARTAWDAPYAASLLERFDLPPRKRVTELSKGQRAALGVVLGLASRAPLTIFDETYVGMDAPSRYAFFDAVLEDFAETGRTFVLSTHHIEEVARLFEDVVIIDRGKVLLQATADELRERGATVTGPTAEVERVLDGATVLARRQLGSVTAATTYGGLSVERRQAAAAAGLEVGPVPLQDLFVHLTEATEAAR